MKMCELTTSSWVKECAIIPRTQKEAVATTPLHKLIIVRFLGILCAVQLLTGTVQAMDSNGELPHFQYLSETASANLILRQRPMKIVSVSLDSTMKHILVLRERADGKRWSDLWSLDSGKLLSAGTSVESNVATAYFTPNDSIATLESGVLRLWNVEGEQRRTYMPEDESIPLAISRDGKFALLVAKGDGSFLVCDPEKKRTIASLPKASVDGVPASFVVSPNGEKIAVATQNGHLQIFSATSGREFLTVYLGLDAKPLLIDFIGTSDELLVVLPHKVFILEQSSKLLRPVALGSMSHLISGTLGRDANTLVVSDSSGMLRVYNLSTNKLSIEIKMPAAIAQTIDISRDGQYIFTGGSDGMVRIFRTITGVEVACLFSIDSEWFVVSSEGRFDTNSINTGKVEWSLSEGGVAPLPLDALAHYFQEPGLLIKLLNGVPLQPLSKLPAKNLMRPTVAIASVSAEHATSVVSVKVLVSNISSAQDVDVRLFRNGVLVGRSIDRNKESGIKRINQHQDLVVTFSGIRVPRRLFLGTFQPKEVEFMVYAYNSDSIRSNTAKLTFEIPSVFQAAKSKAYIVTIGINKYSDTSINRLSFAVDDANVIGRTFERLMRGQRSYATGAPIYDEVIWVPLTSEVQGRSSKDTILAVLRKLAGMPVDVKLLNHLPNASKIVRSTANDYILITFSTHGLVTDNGRLFLAASDAKARLLKNARVGELPGAVSGEELYKIVSRMDAAGIGIIIDACHSAASFGPNGLKYGAWRAQGLGQLAYDKGIQILVASQANEVARESDELKLGFLTYALVKEGIDAGKADFRPRDRRIDFGELFEYAATRTGELLMPRGVTTQNKGEVILSGPSVQSRSSQTASLMSPHRMAWPTGLVRCNEKCSCEKHARTLSRSERELLLRLSGQGTSASEACKSLP